MTSTGKWVLGIIVLIIIVLLLALVAQSGKQAGEEEKTSTEPVKIGFVGPLTGEAANFGINAKAAVEIATEEINASGGVGGRQIEIVYEDDQCTPDVAIMAATKVLNVDKVSAIIGGVCSRSTSTFAPVAESAKVPVLSYCSTAPKISEAGDYIFRNVPSDNFQAKFAADYIYNTLGKKKAAVVYGNDDWGAGIKGAFVEAFKGLGGSIVLEEGYPPTSKDLRSQMVKVSQSKADILYFAGFPDSTIIGIKQLKELKAKVPLFGADTWDDPKVWTDLGSLGEGALFTSAATNSSDDFKAKMQAKLGSDEIVYCSNYAYDGLKMLAKAIGEVGTDGTAIKNALYNMHYEGGVGQPTYEFDANGDPRAAVYTIKVVKNGKAEVLPMAAPVMEATSTMPMATSTTQ